MGHIIRQKAPTLAGIRADHVERYRFAQREAARRRVKTILDAGCGVGYGANLMARHGHMVTAFDHDSETIDYARMHYNHTNVIYEKADFESMPALPVDMVTAFEVIEHDESALDFLAQMAPLAKVLCGSVPNENLVPFMGAGVNVDHYRHFRPEEIRAALESAGWKPVKWGRQAGKKGPGSRIQTGRTDGITIVFIAVPL